MIYMYQDRLRTSAWEWNVFGKFDLIEDIEKHESNKRYYSNPSLYYTMFIDKARTFVILLEILFTRLSESTFFVDIPDDQRKIMKVDVNLNVRSLRR